MNLKIFFFLTIFVQSYASLFKNAIDKIFQMDFPTLDLGNRKGVTNYIDFISLDELIAPVMKGIDINKRPFIVIRVQIVKIDGTRELFFETFFQRYTNYDDLFQGCGKKEFMSTSGGMSLTQLLFLTDLLQKKTVDLTVDIINDLNLFNYITDIEDIRSIDII